MYLLYCFFFCCIRVATPEITVTNLKLIVDRSSNSQYILTQNLLEFVQRNIDSSSILEFVQRNIDSSSSITLASYIMLYTFSNNF